MQNLIEINDLSVSFSGNVILENLSCSIASGKLTALIGPNGAGKTTFLQVLLGLISYDGSLKFLGNKRPSIGYVPQAPDIDISSPLTVKDFLATSITKFPVWLTIQRSNREKIQSILDLVGIKDRLNIRLGDLSGGEFQRVMLANALLREPDLLILDEPQTGVDIVGAKLFCALIEQIHAARGITTVIVTHDLGVVADHAHRVIGLNKKIIFDGDSPEILDSNNLIKLFGPHAGIYASESCIHCHEDKIHNHNHR